MAVAKRLAYVQECHQKMPGIAGTDVGFLMQVRYKCAPCAVTHVGICLGSAQVYKSRHLDCAMNYRLLLFVIIWLLVCISA